MSRSMPSDVGDDWSHLSRDLGRLSSPARNILITGISDALQSILRLLKMAKFYALELTCLLDI